MLTRYTPILVGAVLCTTPCYAVTHDQAPHVTSHYMYSAIPCSYTRPRTSCHFSLHVHVQHRTMQSRTITHLMSLLNTSTLYIYSTIPCSHTRPRTPCLFLLQHHATQSHRIITSSHISEQRAMQSRDMNAHVVHQYAPANYGYMFVQ